MTLKVWSGGSSNAGALENADYSFIYITLRPGDGAPERDLFIGQIELNSPLMLNWIVWNRTVYMNKMDFCIKLLKMIDIPYVI